MSDATLRGGLRPLLFPESVAIVGASDRSPDVVRDLEQVLRGGVPTWFVNPNRPQVLGRECFPSLTALPETPECAYLLVGHTRAEAAFEDVIAAGVRAVVLPGLGAEAGAEGRAVAARIGARAAECDIAVVGPNCMGIATPGGVSLWLGSVKGPESFLPGHVACVAHSGSIAEAFQAAGPRVGFRTLVSAGGELSRDLADFVAFLAGDEGTRAIGLFAETIRRPGAFAAALALAAEAGKPVVCLKVGRSQAAARAALAHSGAVVGSARAFSALLRHHDALEVGDFHELLETLEVLGRERWPRGRRIAGVSESGGECGLLADHGEEAGIPFAPLPDALKAGLVAAFPNYVLPENPLDCWAIDEAERVYPGSLALLRDSGGYDVLLAQVDLSRHRGAHDEGWCSLIVESLADAVEGTDIFPAVTTVHATDPPPAIGELARARDVALLRGTREGLRAIAAVAGWAARERRPAASPHAPPAGAPLPPGPLPEHDSCALLERYGVQFPAARALRDARRGRRRVRAARRAGRRQGRRPRAQAGRRRRRARHRERGRCARGRAADGRRRARGPPGRVRPRGVLRHDARPGLRAGARRRPRRARDRGARPRRRRARAARRGGRAGARPRGSGDRAAGEPGGGGRAGRDARRALAPRARPPGGRRDRRQSADPRRRRRDAVDALVVVRGRHERARLGRRARCGSR